MSLTVRTLQQLLEVGVFNGQLSCFESKRCSAGRLAGSIPAEKNVFLEIADHQKRRKADNI